MTLQQDLKQFTGSERLYITNRFEFMRITDGVKYFADKGGAYWAVTDILATAIMLREQFLVAKVVSKDNKAVITYEDGDCNKIQHATQEYGWTDLPEGEYKFYVIDGVMLLPSEY